MFLGILVMKSERDDKPAWNAVAVVLSDHHILTNQPQFSSTITVPAMMEQYDMPRCLGSRYREERKHESWQV